MRRVWIVALALAVPALAGFECTITSGGDFVPGDSCVYWAEADDSYCTNGGADIVYCATDDWVYEASCATQCPSGIGSCGTDAWGDNVCICESPDVCDSSIDDTYNTCSGDTLSYCDWVSGTWTSYDCTMACPEGDTGRCDYDYDNGIYACICEAGWAWAAGYGCQYVYDYSAGTCDANILTYCAEDNTIYAADCDAHCMDNYGADGGSCGILEGGTYNGCNCTYAACDFADYCYDAQFLVSCDASVGAVWTDCNGGCIAEGYVKGACEANACVCL